MHTYSYLSAARETENGIAETACWLQTAETQSLTRNGTSATPKRRSGKTGNGRNGRGKSEVHKDDRA